MKKEFKDLYAILGVSPAASLKEIKLAYRSLVMKYHPDRHPGDHSAYSHFLQVSEAWEILQDPIKRKKYHDTYFYGHFIPKEKNATETSILDDCRKFLTTLEQADILRMSPQFLAEKANRVFPETSVAFLTRLNKEPLNQEVTTLLLKACPYLPYEAVVSICKKLQAINHEHMGRLQQIETILQRKKKEKYWKRYEVWVYLALVLLFCGIIFLSK